MEKEQHSNREIVDRLLNSQIKLKYILVTVIILGLSVNILASSLFSFLNTISFWANISFSVFLMIVASFWAAYRILVNKSIQKVITGFVMLDTEKNRIVGVNRYSFSDKISEILDATFIEDSELLYEWNSENLNDAHPSKPDNLSTRLLDEAVEYFALAKLSMILGDFFNQPENESSKVAIFNKENMRSFIEVNRIMSLISQSPETRPVFLNKQKSGEKMTVLQSFSRKVGQGRIDGITTLDGHMYNLFELKLPTDTDLSRTHINRLEIKNSLFTLKLGFHFPTYTAVLPRHFEEYVFSGSKSFEKYHPYTYEIHAEITFSIWGFVRTKGWKYYYWLEKFIDDLDDDVSQEKYLEKIGWETAYTVLEVLKPIK